MRTFFSLIFLLIASSITAFAADDGVRVTELVITSRIINGKPIDSIKRLSSATDKNLYCFTRTVAPEGAESRIKHLWYHGDQMVAEYELPVKGVTWRTYSKKSIRKGWSGDWRVEVVDEQGNLLKTVKFKMN